jgi:cytosine/adenosine deaminase-related metal-dependent hydrolase
MEWLNEYAFKAEESLDQDANLARRVYTRLGERLVENGTGAVLLFGTIKEETKWDPSLYVVCLPTDWSIWQPHTC